jgi:hypothetical protein
MNEFFSTSPERHTFQYNLQKKRFEEGKLTQEVFDRLEKMWNNARDEDSVPTKEPSLENDLRSSKTISDKCKNSKEYSQNLYAALCNNDFIKDETTWHCSWRHSGGIVANLNEKGDYIDWYCSGIGSESPSVCEGTITNQIKNDIENLGWKIVENKLD